MNGAKIDELPSNGESGTAHLIFDESATNLNFSVIDGQHRINGAFFAIQLRKENHPEIKWEIPAEIFLDLDGPQGPPQRQAQIFIDVNFHQKKVDKSLVADLFPTARGDRGPLDDLERAQDIGRRLMLETGPLVGMIQVPGIKYGVRDVITLATLNNAVRDVLGKLRENGIESLEDQTEFLAQCLTAWLEASERFEDLKKSKRSAIDPQNVAYQGRVLVSVLALTPAMIWKLKREQVPFISEKAASVLTTWLKDIVRRANLLEEGVFISKSEFKKRGYLGSGGIGRFRDSLWAVVIGKQRLPTSGPEVVAELAEKNRKTVFSGLK